RFITKVNHRITRTVNELNLFAVQKSTAVSVVRSVPCLTLTKGEKIERCRLQRDDDLADAEYRATYDIRDTTLWTLEKFYSLLRQSRRMGDKSFPIVINLLDSLGNRIDSLSRGYIPPWLRMKAEPVRLGFLEKHVLEVVCMFPVHQFWNRSKNSFILVFVFTVLLIVCVMFLTRKINRERKHTIGQHFFLDTVMHNLQSPLDYMSFTQEVLSKKYGNMMEIEDQQALEGIREKQSDMGRAITRLLTLSDIFHRIQIYPCPLCLKEMLEKLCALNFVKILPGKQVNVNISCEMDNQEVSVDPVYLPIVFENLIGNAIKYSGKRVKIDITCQEKGKWIEIRVKDNGIGIPPRSLKHIFEIYYRDPSMRDDHSRKGFGIGLSFVHSVVKAHHGKITVHSVVNVGTEFIIILPRKQWKRK
ncbi:sensor histidine kinase, partial [Butyricimonas paravirosa]